MRLPIGVRAALLTTAFLLGPTIAQGSQWVEGQPYCGSTWTTACASATVELVNGSNFADRGLTSSQWVLVITVNNVSMNDPVNAPGVDTEASVIREMLFFVDSPDGPVSPTADMWVTDGAGNDWDGWDLDTDGEFIRVGETFTQEVGSSTGGCVGIITDPNIGYPPLPCGNNADHRTVGVFHLVFDTDQLGLDLWAAHLVNIDGDGSGTYEESDWAVVPEPGTLALVGTGLFGLGAGLIRRRRRL